MKKKTAYQIINELDASGDLDILVRSGFCSTKAMTYLEIDRRVGAKLVIGVKPSAAADQTAEEFRVCRQVVYRAIRSMKDFGKPY